MRIKNLINQSIKILCLGIMATGAASPFAPTNFHPPYDPTVRMAYVPEGNPFRLGVNFEWGETKKGRNWDSEKRNVLQIYSDDQGVIPMLIEAQNPDATAILTGLTAAYPGQPLDDGIRGHVVMTGEFSQLDATIHGQYVFPRHLVQGRLAISAALPIRHAELDEVRFVDRTKDILAVDRDIKALLSDPSVIKQKVKDLGNLSLENWDETGLGDLLIKLDWSNDYPQDKDGLQNVELHAFLGVMCPTGEERDEDKAFSFAFGNDGAWALPFGIGIDLDFIHNIALGAEAQFEVIFDNTKTRRMKTEVHQSEFLLLNKGRANKDHGLTWKFYLYLQGYHFWRGMSLKGAYEYVKHDSDRLTPKSDDFNASVVNTAKSLDEWNMHNFIVQWNYDFFKECKKFCVVPQMSMFVKIPITGKGVINPYTVGGQFAINF